MNAEDKIDYFCKQLSYKAFDALVQHYKAINASPTYEHDCTCFGVEGKCEIEDVLLEIFEYEKENNG